MAKVDEEKLEILSRCRPGPIGLPTTAVWLEDTRMGRNWEAHHDILPMDLRRSSYALCHCWIQPLWALSSCPFMTTVVWGSSIKDVRTEGEGGQWKRTPATSAAHSARISNRAGQTVVADTSCATALALRQSLAISAETVDERWDSPPLPWHSSSVPLAEGRRTIGYMDTMPAWEQGGTRGSRLRA